MDEPRAGPVDRTATREASPPFVDPRRARLVPPAVTPLRASDLAHGLDAHRRDKGRESFRRAVIELIDGETAATFSSYRRALVTCLRTIDAATPDQSTVLIPAFCSGDFAAAIRGAGLDCRRYDVKPGSLAANLESLSDNLNDDVLAVVAVNVLGYTSDMATLAERCQTADVALVEAIGYAIGARYRGRPLGAFGDYAVVNFQEGKPIPVGGGMIVASDGSAVPSDADRVPARPNIVALAGYAAFGRPRPYAFYRQLARLAERSGLVTDRITTHPGSKRDSAYTQPFPTMSAFQCAVGSRIVDRLDEHRRHRAAVASAYREALADCEGIAPVSPVEGLSNHQHVRYPVLLDSVDARDELLARLREAGIGATRLYAGAAIDRESHPGAASLQRRMVTLPTHPYVDGRDRILVIETIREVLTCE